MIVDTHAHVWDATASLSPARRYTPRRIVGIYEYLDLLDEHDIACAVLVQPSFLDDNNAALLRAIGKAPERLRGIAVLEPSVELEAAQAFQRQGVDGIRFNVLGKDCPDFSSSEYGALLDIVAALDWHVELHAEGLQWVQLLKPLLDRRIRVVVDHFGRPDPALGLECPGFREILSSASTGLAWVKFSAPYRCPDGLVPQLSKALLAHFGGDRIVWGSDYPWTQNENGRTYEESLQLLDQLVDNAETRRCILMENPLKLYKFHEFLKCRKVDWQCNT